MSPLARTLKLNGYSTAQFGKCHEVPVWETSPAGPFDAWPTGGGGFEYFYGFIGGEANQWYPTLYEGTTPVEPGEDTGRRLPPRRGHDRQGDRLDRAAEELSPPTSRFSSTSRPARRTRRITCPRSGPTNTKASSIEAGTQLREETFARQKKLGVIPARLPAHDAPQGDPVVGRNAGSVQAGAAARDGGVRGLHGIHGSPCRPAVRLVDASWASPTTR